MNDQVALLRSGSPGREEAGRVEAVAYTGNPARINGWPWPLVFDLDGLDIPDRPVPLLRDHDRGRPIGHGNAIIRDGQILLEGTLSVPGNESDTARTASLNGFPWQASIGTVVTAHEKVPGGKTVFVNGREYRGPVIVARKAKLDEISVLPLGADDNTKVAIAARLYKDDSMTDEYKTDRRSAVADDVNVESAAADLRADAEQERVAGIERICATGDYGDIRQEAVLAMWTPDETRQKCLEKLRSENDFNVNQYQKPTHPAERATLEATREFVKLVEENKAGRVELAATTSNSGAEVIVNGRPGAMSPFLSDQAAIAVKGASTGTVESPYFSALSAVAATAEEGTKPSMSDPTLKSVDMAAYASTISITDQARRFGAGLPVFEQRLKNAVIFSLNAAVADAFETEGGTPLTIGTNTVGQQLDRAIASVWSQTGRKPSAIVLNSANYIDVAEKTGADSGGDIGSAVTMWNGVVILVNDAITADVAVAVAPGGWTAYRSSMIFDTDPNLSDNTLLARAEMYAAILPHFSGAAVAVALA